jgi:hypothetical protein
MNPKKKRPGAGDAGSQNNLGSSNSLPNTPNAKVEQGRAATLVVAAANISEDARRNHKHRPKLIGRILWRRSPHSFWAVTTHGVECVRQWYTIPARNLVAIDGWTDERWVEHLTYKGARREWFWFDPEDLRLTLEGARQLVNGRFRDMRWRLS